MPPHWAGHLLSGELYIALSLSKEQEKTDDDLTFKSISRKNELMEDALNQKIKKKWLTNPRVCENNPRV